MKWLISLPGDLVRAVVLLVALGSALCAVMGWVSYLAPAFVFASEPALPGLALVLLVGLIWLVLPAQKRPQSAGPLALLAVLLWAAMITPEVFSRLAQRHARSDGAETLKVVQFNLWKDDWSHTAQKEAWIRKQDPDVLLLQEVDQNSTWLLRHLAARYPYRTSCENWRYTCSLLIMSKERPTAFGQAVDEQPNSIWAWARFSRPSGDFVVATVHQPWPLTNGVQQRTMDTLIRDLPRLKSDAIVLTGDFNAAPWSAPMRRFDQVSGLTRQTRLLPSWPAPGLGGGRLLSPLPMIPIDHIYTGPAWKLVSLERGPDLGSDHYPLAAVLTRPGPKTERAPSGKP